MAELNIQINAKTSGKFTRESINGQPHIVTTAMPIRGDVSMNNIFYPDAEVTTSFMQLSNIFAPLGHPFVNGHKASISHPVAMNQHNVGGFLRKPRKKGKRVFVDFVLNETVANQTDEGKALISKIENGEKVGLSTGLGIAQVINKTGVDDFGKPFIREGAGFHFDHVAILVDEAAAGQHAGTELVLNAGQADEIFVTNLMLNELSADELHSAINDLIRTTGDNFTWVFEVFPDSKQFLFRTDVAGDSKMFKQSFAVDSNDEVTLVDDRVEVERTPAIEQFQPTSTNRNETNTMDKDKLILLIATNAAFGFTVADTPRLTAMSEAELVAALVPAAVTTEAAQEIMTNAGHDFAGYEEYKTNKAPFDEFLASRDGRLKTLRETITNSNTGYTEDQLAGKSEDELTIITNMLKKPVQVGEGGGVGTIQHNVDTGAASNNYNW